MTNYEEMSDDDINLQIHQRLLLPFESEFGRYVNYAGKVKHCLNYLIPRMREMSFMWKTRDNYCAKEKRDTFTSIFTSSNGLGVSMSEHKTLSRACCVSALIALDNGPGQYGG